MSHESSSHGISSIHGTYTYICTLTIHIHARMTNSPRSIISQRWHIRMCGISHSYMQYATFIRVPWLDGSIWSRCLFSAVFVSFTGDPKPRKKKGQGLIVFVLIQILGWFIMRGEKTVSIRTGRAAIYLILTYSNLLDTYSFQFAQTWLISTWIYWILTNFNTLPIPILANFVLFKIRTLLLFLSKEFKTQVFPGEFFSAVHAKFALACAPFDHSCTWHHYPTC